MPEHLQHTERFGKMCVCGESRFPCWNKEVTKKEELDKERNHIDFHRLWTACVESPSYSKIPWRDIQTQLTQAGVIPV